MLTCPQQYRNNRRSMLIKNRDLMVYNNIIDDPDFPIWIKITQKFSLNTLKIENFCTSLVRERLSVDQCGPMKADLIQL